jgi:hypothetical protein
MHFNASCAKCEASDLVNDGSPAFVVVVLFCDIAGNGVVSKRRDATDKTAATGEQTEARFMLTSRQMVEQSE